MPKPASINPASYDPPANEPPAPKVDGKKAYQYAGEIVAFGPRPIGSETHRKVEQYIVSHLQGIQVEQDKFTANTAAGTFPMNNIIAKIPGKKDGIIVLASHYDTNYPLRNENFVGANDGASTSGLLIELANVLKSKPNDGYSIWLVFDDGEEATVSWSDSDSLYGTKQLAAKWKNDGTAQKIKAFILLDMIGDKDLDITRETNSTPWLQDVIGRAADRLGYGSYFYKSDQAINDDQLPFKKIGIPVVDLIDFTYGFNNLFHHTTEDTMDKISPKSLQIVGDTVLESIRALNTK
ncbi:MAG: M28 family peptidase [Terriglobia bacterium]|jgi:Zn-dependent M28 family amino/carboxypeptidase|nr:M28 family peptidase [Terriglobia bacterium]